MNLHFKCSFIEYVENYINITINNSKWNKNYIKSDENITVLLYKKYRQDSNNRQYSTIDIERN